MNKSNQKQNKDRFEGHNLDRCFSVCPSGRRQQAALLYIPKQHTVESGKQCAYGADGNFADINTAPAFHKSRLLLLTRRLLQPSKQHIHISGQTATLPKFGIREAV